MGRPYVSYRRLLANSKAAMIAAIELYNKPSIEYRDETFTILLVNSWELLIKAVICREKQTIFYKKKRNEPYRTYSMKDALSRAKDFIPVEICPSAIAANLEHLVLFRDNAVHFYNRHDFSVLIYALGQTAIVNYQDLVKRIFGKGLESEMALNLMPIGLKPPIDPIAFLAGVKSDGGANPFVVEFVRSLAAATQGLEDENADCGRLLTSYSVSLQSVKKIASADLVVGVQGTAGADQMLVTQTFRNPNKAYPFREKNVLAKKLIVDGVLIGQHVFRAVVWKYALKTKNRYCWEATEGVLTKYSPDVIEFLKQLSAKDLEQAKQDYSSWLLVRRNTRSRTA